MTELDPELAEFAHRFHGEVIARARGFDETKEADFREEAFTEVFIEYLAETGAISDGTVCHFERTIARNNVRVDGYFHDEDEDDRLDLFISIYTGAETPAPVSRDDVTRAVKGAARFYEAAIKGVHQSMEPADEAFSMLQRVNELSGQVRELRVFILTDGLAKDFTGAKAVEVSKSAVIKVHVWDVQRLSRCVATGGTKESIEVDFVKEFGRPIPCVPIRVDGAQYTSYLAVFPALVLYRLYEDYGERLLELNVRSFLQARGKVNQNIRKAIIEEPKRFFAYNNGLTAVAEEVRTEPLEGGGLGVSGIRGLQIVNGGQTTASIHRAGKKDGALQQLAEISVQTKLSVIEPSMVDEMVPLISLYANSQNKVSEADFSANDPYHQAIERLSRNIWTPDATSQWFYERARGQYQVARARGGNTPATTKKFDAAHPVSRMFSKTDLATFEHCWDELPYLVGRGGQKNFREFTIRLGHKSAADPDDGYFKDLVAKAIIFRHTQELARAAKIGAYRANIVAYSVAYAAHLLGGRLDLRAIWDRQAVPAALDAALAELLAPVGAVILQTAGTRNVTEWCKREECWVAVKKSQLLDRQKLLAEVPTRAAVDVTAGPMSSKTMSVPAAARRLAAAGLEVIDRSSSNGALWVIGELSLLPTLNELGIVMTYKAGGGPATGGRAGWYMK